MKEGGNQTVCQYCQLFPLNTTHTSWVLQRRLNKKQTCCRVIQHSGKRHFLVKTLFLKSEENCLLCMVKRLEKITTLTRFLFLKKERSFFLSYSMIFVKLLKYVPKEGEGIPESQLYFVTKHTNTKILLLKCY